MHAQAVNPTDAPGVPTSSRAPSPARVMDAAREAAGRVAPLWPLRQFVAVNPFLGLRGRPFAEAAQCLAQAAGARMTMPRRFYMEAIACGRISDEDLELALRHADPAAGLPRDVVALRRALRDAPVPATEVLACVADVVTRATGRNWSWLVIDRISHWAASHFDQGQALWAAPARHVGLYASWREEAGIDRTPRVMGLRGFRRSVRGLPDTVEAMLVEGASRLQLPDASLAEYFHRLLMSVAGWAGLARYRVWQSELRDHPDHTLLELLAVRVAWDVALLDVFAGHASVSDAWCRARARLRQGARPDLAIGIDTVLQTAYEMAWQRHLLGQLATAPTTVLPVRSEVQAAFCIDVRSEVFRRALESVAPSVETLGVAGFFGMPIEFVPLGHGHGHAHCPALLAPPVVVHQQLRGLEPSEQVRVVALQQLRRRAARAWRWFKLAAVSSFDFVETAGWTYLVKLVVDGFGLRRATQPPGAEGIASRLVGRLAPTIEPQTRNGRHSGLPLDTRVALAEGALKAMSLRRDFARLVMFVGHGATTVNNPHASGLNCGACGGHSGENNARVAAAVLNDPDVRRALARRGIDIPRDTWFIAALHDTTTDQVTVYDMESIPATHTDALARLQVDVSRAGARARQERAARLAMDPGKDVDAAIVARSRDWSQIRPEWGLAGCAAFVVAPRACTQALDLRGRVFLNSYDWHQDEGFAVLESIMTAPMVVGSWISLQYYGSTVDNRAFGSGNKVLHNVVGKFGVFEGAAGDLRSGLPWQSLHDGEKLVHEPLRLTVVIAAPLQAINTVIGKHASVRELVDHGWVHLFAMSDDTRVIHRYRGDLRWEVAA